MSGESESSAMPRQVALKRICVFCGSKPGARPEYEEAARVLGTHMVQRGIGLVYGGGSNGLMGAVATTVHDQGGSVMGFIPRALMPREISGESVGELQIVDNMHQRKAAMAENAQAFIALPGGFGTMEELLEMITWSQLGIHSKPVGLLNVEGFYDKLLEFFDMLVKEGFVKPKSRHIVLSATSGPELLDLLQDYEVQHNALTSSESWQLIDGESLPARS